MVETFWTVEQRKPNENPFVSVAEKLFFSCYNGEKPKPVVLIARPRIFAIFHRRNPEVDSNSTETDDSSASGENTSGESAGRDVPPTAAVPASREESAGPLIRNRRDTTKQEAGPMECACTCPVKKD